MSRGSRTGGVELSWLGRLLQWLMVKAAVVFERDVLKLKVASGKYVVEGMTNLLLSCLLDSTGRLFSSTFNEYNGPLSVASNLT